MTAEDRIAQAWRVILYLLTALLVAGVLLLVSSIVSRAHDLDHPEYDDWYAGLMQPDAPQTSCCGKADAYWCDDYFAKGDKAFCRITDERSVKGRPHVPVGTLIEIPPWKLKYEQGGKPIGNPTGHSVVFLSASGHVFCFVQGGGV